MFFRLICHVQTKQKCQVKVDANRLLDCGLFQKLYFGVVTLAENVKKQATN